jgi:hypothetical protein
MSSQDPSFLLGFFTLRLDTPRWTHSHVLEAASRNTAWAGGGVVSFWPSETAYSFAVFQHEQGTRRPSERIAEELGAAVVGDLLVPLREPVPEGAEDWRHVARRHLARIVHEALGARVVGMVLGLW